MSGKQAYEQSYNTENSYENSYKYVQSIKSHENTYSMTEISE